MKIWINKTRAARLCLALAMVAAGGAGSARVSLAQASTQTERLNAAPARRQFIEMLRISRLPAEEQKKSLVWVYSMLPQVLNDYEGLWGAINGGGFAGPSLSSTSALGLAPDKTPEQIADSLLQGAHPTEMLTIYSKIIGRDVLTLRRDDAIAFFNSDFASGDPANIERALLNLEQIYQANHLIAAKPDPAVAKWLGLYADQVIAVFQSDASVPLANHAAQVLGKLGEPRAIDALVERDPQRPTLFYQAIYNLRSLAPPHPRLVAALDSPDEKVRYQAVYALPAAEELLPNFEKLLKDSSANVRRIAASHIFGMSDAAVAGARPQLLPLLSDPDASVRRIVSGEFAERKDAAAAPALLELVKAEAAAPNRAYDQTFSAWARIKHLVGDAFDAAPLSHGSKDEGFQKALKDFEKWIADHPAK